MIEDAGFLHKNVHDFVKMCAARADEYEESVPEFTTWATKTYSDYWYQRLSRSCVVGNAQMFFERWGSVKQSRGFGARRPSVARKV